MQQRAGKIGMQVRASDNAKRRTACLGVLLVMVLLAEEGFAGTAHKSRPTSSRDQVFRVGRLAPTRGG